MKIKNRTPIITSLLDADFYKFSMGQVVLKRYPKVPVRYAFKNRTRDVKLAGFVDIEDLRFQLDCVRQLRFSNTDLHYLRGTNEYGNRMFCEEYLEFLRSLRLPAYELEEVDGTFKLDFFGYWAEVILWETIALAIINELYYKELMSRLSEFERDLVYVAGKTRLSEKIKILRAYQYLGDPGITFSDFGSRRRFSKEWHDYVVKVLVAELPLQFRGTSDVELAAKYGTMPMGTAAHEMDMVYSGIFHANDEDIRTSHQKFLQDWWEEYGWGLSIALTDTFGTDFFFSSMTGKQAQKWKGLRQDSGDPFAFGEKAIAFYEKHSVDPKEKLLVFSDGLDIETIVKLHQQFRGRIKTTFGWGTNLTNDLGFKALSLVIKIVEANGHGVVKLSDNLAKAIGRPEDVERYKQIFGYTKKEYYKECVY